MKLVIYIKILFWNVQEIKRGEDKLDHPGD